MVGQIALCCIFVAVATVEGGLIAGRAPVVQEVDAYPQYNYGYSVQDPISGDVKHQEESRDGDVVRGRYSLVQPDGTLRIVTYMADNSGFHAVVQNQPAYFSTPVQQVVQPQPVQSVVVQQPQPIVVQQQPQQVVVQQPQQVVVQQPQQVQQPVQLPSEPVPVQVPQPAPQPVVEEVFQPQPVQEIQQPQPPQFQPQPQPPQFQPQPQPPQFQPQPQPPQFQPQPPQQIPQQQLPAQPQPTRPPFQQPQLPPQQEETFDDAEVIEARRADSGLGSPSSFRSSRNGQHNFNFLY